MNKSPQSYFSGKNLIVKRVCVMPSAGFSKFAPRGGANQIFSLVLVFGALVLVSGALVLACWRPPGGAPAREDIWFLFWGASSCLFAPRGGRPGQRKYLVSCYGALVIVSGALVLACSRPAGRPKPDIFSGSCFCKKQEPEKISGLGQLTPPLT